MNRLECGSIPLEGAAAAPRQDCFRRGAQPTSAPQMSPWPCSSRFVPATRLRGTRRVPANVPLALQFLLRSCHSPPGHPAGPCGAAPWLGRCCQPGVSPLRAVGSPGPEVPPLSLSRPWGLSKLKCREISWGFKADTCCCPSKLPSPLCEDLSHHFRWFLLFSYGLLPR